VTVIDELVALYAGPTAHQLYDEAVTELEHALQCAALAVDAGVPDDLTAAALLHDVGHLLLDDNVALTEQLTTDHRHEAAGARYLATHGFPPSVTAPIALHVDAKRYLCAVEPDYAASLSPSSVRSLALQGGPMGDAEATAFHRRPGAEDALAVRRWDDRGKVDGLDVGDFERYVPMLRLLLSR
jgi:gamma-butyrobetaine dioxygenase